MRRRAFSLLTAVLLAAITASCINVSSNTPPPSLYLLQAVAAQSTAPAAATEATLALARVELPAYLDRNQLVYRRSAGEVVLSPAARWAEPLHEGIRRVLVENLQRLLPRATILPGTLPAPTGAPRLYLRLSRFEGGPGQTAVLAGEWSVGGDASGVTQRGAQFLLERPWSGAATDLPGVLEMLLADLARALAPRLDQVLRVAGDRAQPAVGSEVQP